MGCGSSKSTETTSNDSATERKPKETESNENSTSQTSGANHQESSNNERDTNNSSNIDPELQKFREQCLEQHNILRKKHGVEPLKLAEDINEIAQKYAQLLGKNNKFEHSDSKLGENLAGCTCKPGSYPTGEYISNMWYDEIKDYDFNDPGFKMGTGHFTQVVWRGSKELGIGIGYQKSGMCVVVANYRPAGNMMGDFPNNVPQLE